MTPLSGHISHPPVTPLALPGGQSSHRGGGETTNLTPVLATKKNTQPQTVTTTLHNWDKPTSSIPHNYYQPKLNPKQTTVKQCTQWGSLLNKNKFTKPKPKRATNPKQTGNQGTKKGVGMDSAEKTLECSQQTKQATTAQDKGGLDNQNKTERKRNHTPNKKQQNNGGGGS